MLYDAHLLAKFVVFPLGTAAPLKCWYPSVILCNTTSRKPLPNNHFQLLQNLILKFRYLSFYCLSHKWAITGSTESLGFYPTRSFWTSCGVRGIKTAGFWYKFSGSCTDSYNCLYTAAITSNALRCTVERWTLLSKRPTCGNSNTSGITRKASNLLWNLKNYIHSGRNATSNVWVSQWFSQECNVMGRIILKVETAGSSKH